MRVRYVDVNGIRTRYYEAGTDRPGPPLLLVHGGGAAADTWFRNLDALGEVQSVLAPDLLGHGFTDLPALTSDQFPQEVEADHIAAFTQALGLDRFALAGHSFGGLIAALVYLADPQRVTRLVLVASSSVFEEPSRHQNAVGGAQQNQLPALLDPTPENIRRRNVGSNYDSTDPFEEIMPIQMSALALPGRLEAFRWVGEGLRASASHPRARVFSRLEEIKVQTLIIAGRNDPRCTVESVEAGAERLPDARLVVFDRCGHKPYSEHAERFNAIVTDFLSGSSDSPDGDS